MRCRVPASGGGWRLGAVALIALAACGPATDPQFAVHDVAVVIRSEEPFTRAEDFPSRVESTVQAALDYWDGSWDALAGRTITFEGSQTVECGTHHGAFGCFDGDIRLTTRDPAFPFSCVEQTVLVHEIGHAIIGDAGHDDPRWMDFHRLMGRLAGRQGYATSGPVDCPIFVSVWQHPPDSGAAAVASAQ